MTTTTTRPVAPAPTRIDSLLYANEIFLPAFAFVYGTFYLRDECLLPSGFLLSFGILGGLYSTLKNQRKLAIALGIISMYMLGVPFLVVFFTQCDVFRVYAPVDAFVLLQLLFVLSKIA